MKKFNAVLKTKLQNHDLVQEKKILLGFKKVYNTLLEKYETPSFHEINETNKPIFLAELNSYWSEDKGLLKKGKLFLKGETDMLNEKSSPIQKKLFIKKRITPIISEVLRQSNLKWKMYDIIDTVYKETKATQLNEVLSPDAIVDTVLESFQTSLRGFMEEVQYELNENAKK
jgi:hypothetical protein